MTFDRPCARTPAQTAVRFSLSSAAVVAALLLPAAANAEEAVLLSTRGDDALSREREAAQRVLAEALTSQSVRVVPRAEAVAELAAGPVRDCDAVDCAHALLQATGGDVAVALAVWAAGEPPAPSTAFVTLVDAGGHRYPGKARVDGRNAEQLERAVKDALLDARALQLLGPGPWLRVRGAPEGADVVLNGKLVGTLPYRAPVESGRHTLEVRSKGHRAHVQTVDVPPSTARQVELEVALEGRGAYAAAERSGDVAVMDADDDASSRPIVGPLILGSAGVALIAADVVAALRVGCQKEDSMGVCLERRSIEEVPAIVVGSIGVLAIAGALVWYVLGAEQGSPERDTASSRGPSWRIGHDGLSVSGHF